MSACIPKTGNFTVIEIGAGSGAVTEKILNRLPKNGRLIALEIQPNLARLLKRKYPDPRLTVIVGDAIPISKHLSEIGVQNAEYVISGLPLGNFSRAKRNAFLSEAQKVLTPNGTYVQFQYFLASLWHIKQFFPRIKIDFEPRNLPPAFVITCKRK